METGVAEFPWRAHVAVEIAGVFKVDHEDDDASEPCGAKFPPVTTNPVSEPAT